MTRYVIQRLLSAVLILLGVSVLTFTISHIIPADPARIAAGPTAGQAQVEALRKAMGLDRPAPEQYLIYLQGILHFDLGRSIRTQQPISEEIVRYLPATLELILFSFVLYTIIGIALGAIAAVKHNSWMDILIRVVSIVAFAVPVYVLGLWLLYGLYFQLGWFPSGGRLDIKTTPPPHVTNFFLIDSLLAGNIPVFLESFQHLILPALTLTLGLLAIATRITRSGMLNELNSKYVQVARLKGVTEWSVVVKHALRNSLIPVLTLMGVQFGYLIGGTVIVETIFQWPGIGLYTFRAITSLDYAAVMGVTLIATFFFVMTNLGLDLLYPVLDPRIAAWGERR
ncbi:MAG TPA: ABC transporter permease [Anaerolineae bacterium]|nr:ABC transporter permease [Anaerolineae bacterium]